MSKFDDEKVNAFYFVSSFQILRKCHTVVTTVSRIERMREVESDSNKAILTVTVT
jgi:hypothetical protein